MSLKPTSVIVHFDMNHPFWDEAVTMRQNQKTISNILDVAVECGYLDLTYSMISVGLRKAPVDLHLPLVTSRYLRQRYEEISRSFNSFSMMKDLSYEAMSKITEIEEDLQDPGLSVTQKIRLENDRWRWYGRAFNWVERCSILAVKLQGVDIMRAFTEGGRPGSVHETDVQETQSVNDWLEQLTEDFKAKLPASPDDDAIVKYFGPENVRPTGVIIDGDATAVEDEED